MINKTYLVSIAIAGGALSLLTLGSTNDFIIPLLILNGFCLFIYGFLRYSWGLYKKNDDSRKYGKKIMSWSVTLLFVTIAFWGFVYTVGKESAYTDPTF